MVPKRLRYIHAQVYPRSVISTKCLFEVTDALIEPARARSLQPYVPILPNEPTEVVAEPVIVRAVHVDLPRHAKGAVVSQSYGNRQFLQKNSSVDTFGLGTCQVIDGRLEFTDGIGQLCGVCPSPDEMHLVREHRCEERAVVACDSSGLPIQPADPVQDPSDHSGWIPVEELVRDGSDIDLGVGLSAPTHRTAIEGGQVADRWRLIVAIVAPVGHQKPSGAMISSGYCGRRPGWTWHWPSGR